MAKWTRCSQCFYGYPLHVGRTKATEYCCLYILHTGKRRPGPPPGDDGMNCLSFKERKGKRPVKMIF